MAILLPDKTSVWNGVKVNEYLLTNHNPNQIEMPPRRNRKLQGITIHNTEAINTSFNTTAAEQYVRATWSGNMQTVRVHFYVDQSCAWQCLPLDWTNWSCADGNGDGNATTIAIEVIGDSKKAEENAAKLTAYLLNKYNLTVEDNVFTHTHWLNVKDGLKGANLYLNITPNPYKVCPIYITPHWTQFTAQIQTYLNKLRGNVSSVVKDNQPAAADEVNVIYQAYTTKWLSSVTNCNEVDENGYAGYNDYPIRALAIKTTKGKVRYRVHNKNGNWLNWISDCDTTNWNTGCAGVKGRNIDGVQIVLEGLDNYQLRYRVMNCYSQEYLPWIVGENDYAGVFGKNISKIQIEIVKIK